MRAWIGLGSNLGDGRRRLREALASLDATDGIAVLRASSLYRTAPWGLTDQPHFSNAVAELDTTLQPLALLERLLAVERAAGRVRGGLRWGPRTLDLDLLVYGYAVVETPRLHVPHPHLHERDFVLVPLAELEPGLEIPGRGRVRELLAQRAPEAVAREAGSLWP